METDEQVHQWAGQLRHDGHDWSEVATELGCTEDLAAPWPTGTAATPKPRPRPPNSPCSTCNPGRIDPRHPARADLRTARLPPPAAAQRTFTRRGRDGCFLERWISGPDRRDAAGRCSVGGSEDAAPACSSEVGAGPMPPVGTDSGVVAL
ncbi:hypothetical protein ACFYSW_27445 [Rhodococcus aetherivorans]|uniref:hypothetical protein n=1 Tax=Rhodococcus aetherivorans TaxID=191292 RepID=UPI0036BF2256